MNELIDAKATAFASNGVALSQPTSVKNYLSARRAYIVTQLDKFRVPFALTGQTSNELRSSEAVVTVSGAASFDIQALRINGLNYPATWTSVTNWSVVVPLRRRRNDLVVVGIDAAGQPIPEATQAITVTYTGAEPIAPLRVVINEWMAANTATLADPADGDYDDWFELYNPHPFPVDLSGYQLTDEFATGVRSRIPAGVIIGPEGFLLVWADGEMSQNGPDSDLHVGFNLRRSGEAITLMDPDGRLVDQVNFGAQSANVSEGRWPDGNATFVPFMPEPTPGAPNIVADAASPLRILGVSFSPRGTVTLTWTAQNGRLYRLQSKDRLDAEPWTEIVETMAAGPTGSVTLSTGGTDERYYRVEALR